MRSVGADRVIDYRRDDFTRTSLLYDLILDLAAHRSMFAYRRALAPGGAYRCVGGSVPVVFMTYFNWRGIDGHRMMRRHGFDQGLTSFIGLLESHPWANGEQLTRIDYGYHIGYVWMVLDWTKDLDRSSWFEHQSIDLPRLNARVRDRLGWLPYRVSGELRHIWHTAKKSQEGG